MSDLNLTSQKKVHKTNTAMHVINRTTQASQSTVALKAAKHDECGGSKIQKKTRQNPSHWSADAAMRWGVQDIQMDW